MDTKKEIMDDRKWILGYDDSKGSGCLCGL